MHRKKLRIGALAPCCSRRRELRGSGVRRILLKMGKDVVHAELD
ncbi:hypothetical protein [Amycolatopsis lurida]|nr:hypothetical protein [Amycolatopsis lurida]